MLLALASAWGSCLASALAPLLLTGCPQLFHTEKCLKTKRQFLWAIPIAAFLSLLFSSETLHLAAFGVGLLCLLAPCRGGIEKMAGPRAHRPCSQHAGKAWLRHKAGVSIYLGLLMVFGTHVAALRGPARPGSNPGLLCCKVCAQPAVLPLADTAQQFGGKCSFTQQITGSGTLWPRRKKETQVPKGS